MASLPKVVLRRLTHSQYNNTVRDLLKDTSDPASQFPPEDYVNGFKNQYEALSVSPILAEAYSRSAEQLAANAFRRGDSRGLIPCKPASDDDAACRTKFIQTFGRRAFRRPLDTEEIAPYQAIFKARKEFSRRRAGRDRDHAAVAQLSSSGWKKRPIPNGSRTRRRPASPISSGTPRRTTPCWTAPRGAN